jgi:hypothetical protein
MGIIILVLSLLVFFVTVGFIVKNYPTGEEEYNLYILALYNKDNRYLGTTEYYCMYDEYRMLDLFKSTYYTSFVITENGAISKDLISKIKIQNVIEHRNKE